jgi:hypothetical protein
VKPEVERAIAEIQKAYSETTVTVREDDEGGAYVILEEVAPGPAYREAVTWIGFRVTFQYPYSDVYPHYVRGDLSRADGRGLGDGMSQNQNFEGRPAVQISRRSNHLDPRTQTALIKLQKVLLWLAARA